MPHFSGPRPKSPNKMKGNNGHWRTESLFVEMNRHEHKYPSIYSIKDDGNGDYPSLYRLFLDEMDPTEYGFAEKYLGGWQHWEHLQSLEWFKPIVDRWRAELAKRIQHHLATEAQKIVADPNSSQSAKLRAMKFIAAAEYEPPPHSGGKGRPSKEEVKGELKRMAKTISDFDTDFERLGLGKPN